MRLGSWTFSCLAAALAWLGCGPEAGTQDPSDDPAAWQVAPGAYRLEVGAARFVVPSAGLPARVRPQAANNNVDLAFHDGRVILAWRSAPSHFASADAELWVVSSADGGETWAYEAHVALGSDVREPRLLAFRGELQLMFFEAGTDPLAFEPRAIWRLFRRGAGDWTAPERWLDAPVVPWDLKARAGRAWLTAYAGEHYTGEPAGIDVLFWSSEDGREWSPVEGQERVYRGGVSEVAFELDAAGGLWAVGRNEDGDQSGFGAQVCRAEPGALADWRCLAASDPERYDSPELFRHGEELYLAARRDVGGPFGPAGDMVAYSLRPKRSALYRLDAGRSAVEHLTDLPGAGDTAFPAVRRSGAHTFLLANYTSPLDDLDLAWLEGQTSPRGTQIYLSDLTFVPE
jgi:hypothetical protein